MSRISDHLLNITLDGQSVPVLEFFKLDNDGYVEVVAPKEDEIPRIDIYLLVKESRIYVWAQNDEQLEKIKDRIYSKFSPYTNKEFHLIETQTTKYGKIREFTCRILN
ncbi:MAG: hypothetical protein DWQ19_10880 [Crenarchaeota archaeon]|nr:MAG: hypothetical protein DWQ19_10880 [Thermoproteota archaeon]